MQEKTREILGKSKVEGVTLKLPDIILDRKEYLDIKKVVDGLGGKWKGGKVSGFIFKHCPKDLISKLLDGDKINLKKDFQFFPTPTHLADKLVELAEIEPDHKILEPSAGQGGILRVISKTYSGEVYYYELMEQNRLILENDDLCIGYLGDDYMKPTTNRKFDRIIANPPFTKNQDIDHVYRMYEDLAEYGRIVTIVGTSWQKGSQKKQVAFRDWLESVDAEILNIDAGEFKESGTNIETRIIIINKV